MPTPRQQMCSLLSEKEMGARELSQALALTEKEVYGHLSHIARSVASRRQRLIIDPAVCHACGFTFNQRKRLTPPSRCPRCKSERIKEPTYRIA